MIFFYVILNLFCLGTEEVNVFFTKYLPINPEAKLFLYMIPNHPQLQAVQPILQLGKSGRQLLLKNHRRDLKLFSTMGGLQAKTTSSKLVSLTTSSPKASILIGRSKPVSTVQVFLPKFPKFSFRLQNSFYKKS